MADRIPLRDSKRREYQGERVLGQVEMHEAGRVIMRLRPRAASNPQEEARMHTVSNLQEEVRTRGLGKKRYLTRTEYRDQYGADPIEMKHVRDYYQHNMGLTLTDQSQSGRYLSFMGSVDKINRAFGVQMQRYEAEDYKGDKITYMGNPESIQIPPEFENIIVDITGLDERPVARPHVVVRRAAQPLNTYTPKEIAQMYNFPNGANGFGQTIAILEFGGGYRPEDLETYFGGLGIAPIPNVNSVSVGRATNNPGVDSDADVEVTLDIQIAGTIAPRANIVTYFAQNSEAGFLHAFTKAIHDDINNPSIISLSWGAAEPLWTDRVRQQIDAACQAAAVLGITICVASGDAGSNDNPRHLPLPAENVDFPASSPYVLACGGTRLNAANGVIVEETVWNDSPASATGGGVSTVFQRPDWQQNLSVVQSPRTQQRLDMRGVPDVAGDADPDTGYRIFVNGQQVVIGGTSAVAPLWAGLVALLNQSLNTRLGLFNPALYTAIHQGQAFNDITQGNNGGYVAAPDWDACTGWGSPRGLQLLNQLTEVHWQAKEEVLPLNERLADEMLAARASH
jgi:kumamolisin